MNGRLEGELKKKQVIDTMLEEMPAYVGKWVLTMRASDKTETSIYDYVYKVRKFLKYVSGGDEIKTLSAEKITSDITCEYFISLQTKEKDGILTETSDSFKITNWFCLNSFLGFMQKRNLIPYNYMEEISKPKDHDLARINENRIRLTEDDFNAIIRAVKYGAGSRLARSRQKPWRERDMAILLLFMSTGMRKTALSQINVDDVDFDTGTLIVRDKGDKNHKYVLKDHVKVALEKWIDKRGRFDDLNTQALFISNLKKRMSGKAIEDLVVKYSEEGIGVGISPHKIRAGFCTILYSKNPDILFVSNAVGHSSIDVTRRYIVTRNEEKEKAAGIMDVVLNF